MMEENRMCLPGVGSPEKNHIGFFNLLVGVRAAACSENHRQTGDARGVSSTVATIDIVTSHDDARELLRHKVHLVRRLRATEQPERLRSTLIDRGFQTAHGPIHCFVPCSREQGTAAAISNQRLSQPYIWFSLR